MIGEMSGRPWLFLASGQIAAADFPSYVSTGSVNGDMALNYGWGAWVHNNNFTVGTWSRDGTMLGGDSAIKLYQLTDLTQRLCRAVGKT